MPELKTLPAATGPDDQPSSVTLSQLLAVDVENAARFHELAARYNALRLWAIGISE